MLRVKETGGALKIPLVETNIHRESQTLHKWCYSRLDDR